MELDDDVFFKDLSKQISLLIMDDEEDPHLNLQALSRAIHSPATQASFFSYDHQQASKRQSKGTGVFIPHPRRKNARQARLMASGGNKFQEGLLITT